MDQQNLQVLILHHHPEFLQQCCDLINAEWPRSETARMMSLKSSCDELPTSLILVQDEKRILGHCKLTAIPSIPESCFIETVVIHNDMRGKKLGSFLMKKTEEYCKDILNKQMIHLSTKGQEIFYKKLGYTICAPVSIYGTHVSSDFNSIIVSNKNNTVPVNTPGPPPPPPPPMPRNNINNKNKVVKTLKTYMFKNI